VVISGNIHGDGVGYVPVTYYYYLVGDINAFHPIDWEA
jgi:hypothetical protein